MAIIKDSLKVIIISLIVSSGVYFAFAQTWSGPTENPPMGNVPAPLNAGSSGQIKEGGLLLNSGGASIGLIVDKGNVGIGTLDPSVGKLVVNGSVDVLGNRITSLAAPIASSDAASKEYVDAQAVGPYWAYRSCRASGGGGSCTVSCPAGTVIQGWTDYRDDSGNSAQLGRISNSGQQCAAPTLGGSTSLTCSFQGPGSYTIGIVCSK